MVSKLPTASLRPLLRPYRYPSSHKNTHTSKYPENTPKVPRKCHVFLSGWIYLPPIYSLCDVAGTAQGEEAEPYIYGPLNAETIGPEEVQDEEERE